MTDLQQAMEARGEHGQNNDVLRAEVTRLREDLEEAKRALAFYAEPSNYRSPSTGFAAQYDPEPSPIAKQGGRIAREALDRIKAQEGEE